jgi:U3 small nucleolar RNA-associated protein 18
VESLHWHPQASVLLTAGLDKTLRLFHVDGKENAKIKSVFFKDLPIKCARFAPGGHEIVVSGRRSYFYTFDLERERAVRVPFVNGRSEKSLESFEYSPCGRFIAFQGDRGHVVLLSAQTKQPLGFVQMNAPVRAVTFSPDGQHMYTAGTGSDVYIWDLRNQRNCVHRFMDDGVLKNSCLSMSPNGAYFASGSTSGIVNIYDTPSIMQSSTPAPRKFLDNLTTNISQVAFNHDGQILAIGSRVKKDAFRLVHLPSGRVFSNWPTQQTPLNYVQCFGFSAQSHFLAVGNAKGKVGLWNLAHFNQ